MMNCSEPRRIGIFEYDWSMYGLTKDFAVKLAESGYLVDIFYKDVDQERGFADTSELEQYATVRYFNFTTRLSRFQVWLRRFKRLTNRFALRMSIKVHDTPYQIISPEILRDSQFIVGQSHYVCLVGIEKSGLIWAGLLSQLYECPLIYYSLELYIEDHPQLYQFYHLRNAEKKFHQLCCATIVQDKSRADALLESNGATHADALYYPVSVRGDAVREKSKFLHNFLHVADDKKILLYFGSMYESRFVTDIVRMAENLDDEFVLVCHGWGPKKYVTYLRSIVKRNNVLFSLDLVNEGKISELVSSADMGLALYATTNANDRLVAFSSIKLAYYAQCGLPVIAFASESLQMLMYEHKWGELIDLVDQVPQAVRRIVERYDKYRLEAYRAFEKFYSCDRNFSRLLPQLEEAFSRVRSEESDKQHV
jgi:hypothetical protein